MRRPPMILLAAILAAGTAAPARAQALPAPAAATIRDDLGRAVAVPARVERIVSIQPEISRMIISLGAGDRLVGIEYALRDQDHLFGIIYPAGAHLPLVSMSENGVNVEEVFRLKPDLIFASPFERQIVEALQRKTSIPVLALASMGRFGRQAEILALLGRILAREARAAELAAYFDARIGSVREALRDLPETAKPRVFLSFWGVLTKTPIHYDPVDAAGGIKRCREVGPGRSGGDQHPGGHRAAHRLESGPDPGPRQLSAPGPEGHDRKRALRSPPGLGQGRPDRQRPLHVRVLELVGHGRGRGRDTLPGPALPSRPVSRLST